MSVSPSPRKAPECYVSVLLDLLNRLTAAVQRSDPGQLRSQNSIFNLSFLSSTFVYPSFIQAGC